MLSTAEIKQEKIVLFAEKTVDDEIYYVCENCGNQGKLFDKQGRLLRWLIFGGQSYLRRFALVKNALADVEKQWPRSVIDIAVLEPNKRAMMSFLSFLYHPEKIQRFVDGEYRTVVIDKTIYLPKFIFDNQL